MSGAKAYDVTAYGESMLRLSVPPGRYLVSSPSLDLNVGGAESNVCGALAQLGRRTGWFSALPVSPLSQIITSRLQQAGVDISGVQHVAHGRVGAYFLESAYPPLPTTVQYDRADSAFSQHALTDQQLAGLLDTRIVHLTGITPALGAKPLEAAETIFERAQQAGVTVSFDVNYRQRLWSSDSAVPTLRRLAQRADILFCSLRDAVRLYGAAADGRSALNALRANTSAQLIVVSLGAEGVIADHQGATLTVPAVPTELVDRPGAGDALAAAVLDGYLAGDVHQGLRHGVALASIALSHLGDMVFVQRATLEAVASGGMTDIAR